MTEKENTREIAIRLSGVKKQYRLGQIMAVALDCPEGEDRVMLRMNGSAADILALLKEDTTEDAVVAGMLAQYDADEATIRENVKEYVQKLRDAGLIVE